LCRPLSDSATVILLCTYFLFMLQGEVALRLELLARIPHYCSRGGAGKSKVQLRLLQGNFVLIGGELLLSVHLTAVVLLRGHLLLPVHRRGYFAIHVLNLRPLHPLRELRLLQLHPGLHLPVAHYTHIRNKKFIDYVSRWLRR
jgi:hypothetical protein